MMPPSQPITVLAPDVTMVWSQFFWEVHIGLRRRFVIEPCISLDSASSEVKGILKYFDYAALKLNAFLFFLLWPFF